MSQNICGCFAPPIADPDDEAEEVDVALELTKTLDVADVLTDVEETVIEEATPIVATVCAT